MADKTTTPATQELRQTALELFSTMPMGNYSPEQRARRAFVEAQAFNAVASEVESGKLKLGEPQPADVLNDAFAPNLPDDHPINMISRERGSLAKREELLNRLRKPTQFGVKDDEKRPGYNRLYLESVLGTTSAELIEAGKN